MASHPVESSNLRSNHLVGVMGFYRSKDNNKYYAGYVILDGNGDAIEFCWSADIEMPRLARVLSGKDYLANRLKEIARALLDKAENKKPGAILFNQPEVLSLDAGVPLAAICRKPTPEDANRYEGLSFTELDGEHAVFCAEHSTQTEDIKRYYVEPLRRQDLIPKIFEKIQQGIQDQRSNSAPQ